MAARHVRVVGAGAVVENTHFRQGYDSWMKVKCYNSTITNNLFEAARESAVARTS